MTALGESLAWSERGLEGPIVPGPGNGKGNPRGLDINEQPAPIRAIGGTSSFLAAKIAADPVFLAVQNNGVLGKGEDLPLARQPDEPLAV